MSGLKENFISPTAYNSLPTIQEVADVPSIYNKDRDDLRDLLQKHQVPDVVCVRLIHKHFDIVDGEIMVLREVQVQSQGTIQIMGPMNPQKSPKLRGLNYIVDDDGQFQSYEYTTSEGPDMENYGAFLKEFRQIIIERGLQTKWGLKIGVPQDKMGWIEFEFPEKRSTLAIPPGVELPSLENELSVTTDWRSDAGPIMRCSHCNHCTHCKHWPYDGLDDKHRFGKCCDDLDENELCFAGVKVKSGSPIHDIISAAIMAM
jgi:hypothetical protein